MLARQYTFSNRRLSVVGITSVGTPLGLTQLSRFFSVVVVDSGVTGVDWHIVAWGIKYIELRDYVLQLHIHKERFSIISSFLENVVFLH